VPPKPVSFESLHGGSAIRFLGSVYATAQNISNLRSQEMDKDVPHERAAAAGRAGRGVVCRRGVVVLIFSTH
jgi:hypothetical protein